MDETLVTQSAEQSLDYQVQDGDVTWSRDALGNWWYQYPGQEPVMYEDPSGALGAEVGATAEGGDGADGAETLTAAGDGDQTGVFYGGEATEADIQATEADIQATEADIQATEADIQATEADIQATELYAQQPLEPYHPPPTVGEIVPEPEPITEPTTEPELPPPPMFAAPEPAVAPPPMFAAPEPAVAPPPMFAAPEPAVAPPPIAAAADLPPPEGWSVEKVQPSYTPNDPPSPVTSPRPIQPPLKRKRSTIARGRRRWTGRTRTRTKRSAARKLRSRR